MKLTKIVFNSLLVLAVIIMAACSNSTDAEEDQWQLIWQDEFDGPAGQSPNPEHWTFDIGTDWGNAQLEYSTDRPENVSLDGQGNLAIIARQESYEGRNYTSGRITTQDIFEPTFGKFEARMQLPWGSGIWPAFWLLGANVNEVGWPQCGEIDIMEYRGQEPSRIHGSLHGPGYSGAEPVTSRYDLYNDRFDTGFHLFAVEWSENLIKWYVDGTLYQTVRADDVPGTWVYDHPFYIILNLAVGGNYVGPPNGNTVFPQTLLVDYVRVYEKKN